jgi:hypothetical protein
MRFPRLRLPASGWRRRLAQCGVVLGVLFLLLTLLGFSLWGLFQVPAFQGWFFTRMIELTPPATPEETPGKPGIRPVYAGPVADGHQAKSAADVHGVTNFWNIHLSFTGSEWEGIQYRRVPPVRDWLGPDGQPTLRNPKASRNGLAGVLGFDFPWSAGDVELGGVPLRPLIAEWSTNRLARFDVAVSAVPGVGSRDGKGPMDPDRATWQIRRFVRARFESVRGQLDGAVEGVVLTRRKP